MCEETEQWGKKKSFKVFGSLASINDSHRKNEAEHETKCTSTMNAWEWNQTEREVFEVVKGHSFIC